MNAREVIKLALADIFGGVQPTGYASSKEEDIESQEIRRDALRVCVSVENFDGVFMILSSFLRGGLCGQWETQACNEYIADLTKRLESCPFYPQRTSPLTDNDRNATDRQFYVSGTVAAAILGVKLNTLSKLHTNKKIMGAYTLGRRLFIPIGWVDQKRVVPRQSKSRHHEKDKKIA